MITIEKEKIELALHVIDLKKAQMIKNNKEKTYADYKNKMDILFKEKQEIYKLNEEVIKKVLTEYLDEVKKY